MNKDNNDKLNYIREIFCKDSGNLEKLNLQIKSLNLPKINLPPESRKIIQLLIKLVDIKKIIEIGTYIGHSAISMAEMLDKDAEIYTIEKNILRADLAKENFLQLNYKNIKIFSGEALEILNQLSQYKPFDMIFIDGNKSQYLDYLDWAEINIRKNGLIISDNIFLRNAIFSGEKKQKFSKANIEKMRLFNERLANQQNYFTSIFPSEDGLAISIKLF